MANETLIQDVSLYGYSNPADTTLLSSFGYLRNGGAVVIDGITIIKDHKERAVSLLIEQFRKDYL